jgi:hypothetical protein
MRPRLDEIRNRFHDNLRRVKNLIDVYVSSSPKGQGRRTVRDADILRAAVVLLHANLEDLLRSLAGWKLPLASPEFLAEIPISGNKRGTRIGLQELASFRGQTVDEVITKSISEHLEKVSYNHPGDIKDTLEKIGLDPKTDKDIAAELAAMMSRRHWIAHCVDANPAKGSGHHPVKSLSNLAVSRWIVAVEQSGKGVLANPVLTRDINKRGGP